jgi:hypothetical protein
VPLPASGHLLSQSAARPFGDGMLSFRLRFGVNDTQSKQWMGLSLWKTAN